MTLARRDFLSYGAALSLAGMGGVAAADAGLVKVAGLEFERAVNLAGTELLLNGVGLRAVAWFKGYAAALYLRQRQRNAAAVLAESGAKRLQLRMLVDVPATEFVRAIDKGLARNSTPPEQRALAARQADFNARVQALGTVRKGDVVNLDYEPELGLRMLYNGSERGEPLPGADFYAAVLRIFVGERPVDVELKAGLLGGPTG
jgi:hypothetical protein